MVLSARMARLLKTYVLRVITALTEAQKYPVILELIVQPGPDHSLEKESCALLAIFARVLQRKFSARLLALIALRDLRLRGCARAGTTALILRSRMPARFIVRKGEQLTTLIARQDIIAHPFQRKFLARWVIFVR